MYSIASSATLSFSSCSPFFATPHSGLVVCLYCGVRCPRVVVPVGFNWGRSGSPSSPSSSRLDAPPTRRADTVSTHAKAARAPVDRTITSKDTLLFSALCKRSTHGTHVLGQQQQQQQQQPASRSNGLDKSNLSVRPCLHPLRPRLLPLSAQLSSTLRVLTGIDSARRSLFLASNESR